MCTEETKKATDLIMAAATDDERAMLWGKTLSEMVSFFIVQNIGMPKKLAEKERAIQDLRNRVAGLERERDELVNSMPELPEIRANKIRLRREREDLEEKLSDIRERLEDAERTLRYL